MFTSVLYILYAVDSETSHLSLIPQPVVPSVARSSLLSVGRDTAFQRVGQQVLIYTDYVCG